MYWCLRVWQGNVTLIQYSILDDIMNITTDPALYSS